MDIELIADRLKVTEEALLRLDQRLDGLEEQWTQQHETLNGSIPSQETVMLWAKEVALAEAEARASEAEALKAEAEAAEAVAEAAAAEAEALAEVAIAEAAGEPPEEVPGPEQVEIIEAGEDQESEPEPKSRNSELESLMRGQPYRS